MSILQRIIEFLKNIFSGGGGNPQPPTPPRPPEPQPDPIPVPPDDPVLPDPPPPSDEDGLNSDGSDILVDPDTIGTVVFPEELEIKPPTHVESTDPTDPVVVVPPPSDPETGEDGEDNPETPKHKPRYTWCLDNGHGKFTPGKRSPKFEDGSRFYEYEFNRDIVNRVIKKLDEIGVKYFNVVPEVETDNFLKGRVDRANAHQSDLPKLFVSVHANAANSESINHWANPPARGLETWYYHGSRRGRSLASVFQKHLVQYTGMVNRGLKSTKGLYVIKNTSMTAVLTENGFFNHKEEAKELMKEEVRQLIADAHVAAILEVEKNGL